MVDEDGPQPLESAESIRTLYERHAQTWDARRRTDRRFLEAPWIDRFTSWLPRGGTVLDLGCGSGVPIASRLAESGFSMTGVDSSATLIEIGRARMPEHTWIVADMRHVDFDRRFHGIVAWHSFFHLTPPDQRAMIERFATISLPGAPLLFTSGPQAGVAIGCFEGEPLYHASLDPEEYDALLSASGFRVIAQVSKDPECGDATVWLAVKE